MSYWSQDAADNQLKLTVEENLEAARVRRQQESVRRGKREVGPEWGSRDRKG